MENQEIEGKSEKYRIKRLLIKEYGQFQCSVQYWAIFACLGPSEKSHFYCVSEGGRRWGELGGGRSWWVKSFSEVFHVARAYSAYCLYIFCLFFCMP